MGYFRNKITPWWASSDQVHIAYKTGRFQIFWKRVYAYDYDILSGCHYMAPFKVHFSSAEEWLDKFNSIEKIREYEANEQNKVDRGNQNKKKQDEIKQAKKSAIYKKFS